MGGRTLSGLPVVVMGLGRFGGGIGVTRWLVQQGAKVTVTDTASEESLAGSIEALAGLPVRFRLGSHDAADLQECRLLVVSPAVPKERSDFVGQAVARGIPLSSEMNLFLERCPARRVVGVTGSAGKSTTTAMIGEILRSAQEAGRGPRVWVGGNIGWSLLNDLEDMSADDVVVLELSSFQLEDVAALPWSPPLAVITNLQPNHLDRHGTLEAYIHAKMNIVRFQRPDGLVLVHEREGAVAGYVTLAGGAGRLRRFSFDPMFADQLRLPGRHNQDNAGAAIAVARALNVPDEVIAAGLAGFTGLPHRLALAAERGGVRYYNDSKSTTPASTQLAVEAFDRPVIVLIGGRDKGMPFDEMAAYLAAKAKAVVCYGEICDKLYRMVSENSVSVSTPSLVFQAESLAEAIERARLVAEAGDVVVMSPACTSYDMFTNYEERGEAFCRLVRALPV